jgi:hypothetical protein
MIQERKRNFVQSLLMTFQKFTRHEGPSMSDSDLLESRRKIEQRIDFAIENLGNRAPNETERVG